MYFCSVLLLLFTPLCAANKFMKVVSADITDKKNNVENVVCFMKNTILLDFDIHFDVWYTF